ncbi:MAG: OmpA/MotB family protein [Myxococcaceae bacterium]
MDDFDGASTQRSSRPSRLPWVLVGLLLAWVVAGLYFGLQLYNAEKAAAQSAEKTGGEAVARAKSLEARVAQLESEKKTLAEQASALTEDLKEKEAELDKLKATYDSLEDKMKAEIKRGDIELTQVGGKIRVGLVDKVLFDSGEAELSARGKEVLTRLGAVLSGISDKQIQVSGHTDDAAITDKLKVTFPTNWELSAARAVNVVRFLSEEGGVPPARLMAAGYGPYHPVGTNANPAGRARNRRIEVLLTPALQAEPAKIANQAGKVAPPAAAAPAKALPQGSARVMTPAKATAPAKPAAPAKTAPAPAPAKKAVAPKK